MDKLELQKLAENLKKRLKEIDNELGKIAIENPAVKGDFKVQIEDVGSSQEDAAQEAGELDRNQALVDTLERERKDINHTLQKIEDGTYGKCETCSGSINPARLKAIPVAPFCMNCAGKHNKF